MSLIFLAAAMAQALPKRQLAPDGFPNWFDAPSDHHREVSPRDPR